MYVLYRRDISTVEKAKMKIYFIKFQFPEHTLR